MTGSSLGRFGTALLGAVLMGCAGWLTLRNLGISTSGGWIFWVPITTWLVTMGVLCWWFTMSSDQAASRAAIKASWRAGWKVGTAGLAIGFVGPLVIYPKSNLGPLLGILVTGPLGFVVGVVGAAVVRVAKSPR
jgi:hypothetical protein